MRFGAESHRPLLVAIAVSVVIHGVAAAAFVLRPEGERGAERIDRAVMPPSDVERPPVELGRDESPHVSINWLGFEDPTEHRAIRSQTDQAAMAIPRADEAIEAETAEELSEPVPAQVEAAPVAEPVPPVESPAEQQAERATEPAVEAEPVAEVPAEAAPPAVVEAPAAALPVSAETPDLVTLRLPVLGLAGLPDATAEGPSESGAEPAQRPVEAEAAATPASAPPPAATPAEPATPAAEAVSRTEEGDPNRVPPADRDSDPTSREIVVSTTQLGRPVIGQGIEIIPVRPNFSVATRILTTPRDPVVLIAFGPDGRVTRAVFAVDETGKRLDAGSSSVDEPLLDAIYRWRAKGARIDELARSGDPEARVEIRMRIRLN